MHCAQPPPPSRRLRSWPPPSCPHPAAQVPEPSPSLQAPSPPRTPPVCSVFTSTALHQHPCPLGAGSCWGGGEWGGVVHPAGCRWPGVGRGQLWGFALSLLEQRRLLQESSCRGCRRRVEESCRSRKAERAAVVRSLQVGSRAAAAVGEGWRRVAGVERRVSCSCECEACLQGGWPACATRVLCTLSLATRALPLPLRPKCVRMRKPRRLARCMAHAGVQVPQPLRARPGAAAPEACRGPTLKPRPRARRAGWPSC